MTNHSPTSAIISLLKKITDGEVYKGVHHYLQSKTWNDRKPETKKNIRESFIFSVESIKAIHARKKNIIAANINRSISWKSILALQKNSI